MFQATLAKRESKDARKARKMAEIEARARAKFRKTAIDPERVKKQLDARNGMSQRDKKKFLKNRLARSLMSDNQKVASQRSLEEKKLRSKKILYGTTGQEVEYHPGDRVRLGDWLELHSSYKYNGSIGIIVEKVVDGNADDVELLDLKTKREFSKYKVRVPIVKAASTFTSVVDSSLYQKVDKEVEILVKKDKITLIKSDSIKRTSAANSWQEQTKGYFDEDDLVDPNSGLNARLRIKQQLIAAKEAKSAASRKKDPNIALSREQKAKLQYAREMEHWREEDEKFHESNRAVSTALFLWNENSKEGPQKPQQQKFQSFTVKSGTGLPSIGKGSSSSKGGRKVERREDPSTGGYFTRREFVDYYGDLTQWSRAKATAIFQDS